MNEWGFAAEIKSWWDAVLRAQRDWGLDRCSVEEQVDVGGGSLLRSDLTVRGPGGVALAGELRLPDHPHADPWDPDNLLNAFQKAVNLGARWAFTSDANRLLLIDTEISGPIQDRVVLVKDVGTFTERAQLDVPSVLASTERSWVSALEELVPLVLGRAVPVGIPPDERFIQSLRGLLRRPVQAIAEAVDRRRLSDPVFEAGLVQWMVDEQSWVHVAAEWDAEIRRTAMLTAYVFTTRCMFYEALRRAEPSLATLALDAGLPAAAARGLMQGYFDDARAKSEDYETVFTWDRACDYALIDDAVVAGWARVIERLSHFDLAHIDYDVVGQMFERLIEPHERYRYGQHYTEPEVVDLMLSFALQNGLGAIADFAAGGGTFLVRAYARMKSEQPERSHQELLADLYGCDISAFASSLATVNLAVRGLVFQANYPQVAASSFFRLRPGLPYMQIPNGRGGQEEVIVPSLRAVTTNPPYVRIQQLSPAQRQEAMSIAALPYAPSPPATIPRASNYHVYFWYHAARFLADDGRLVFITSGEWMDSDYGVALQKWLLDNFRILVFIETLAEQWFSEARVGTIVTVAERCEDHDTREAQVVRFSTLRKPLRSFYGNQPTPADHFARVDALRDRILALSGAAGESDDLDWKTITQGDLRALGTEAA